MDEPVVTPPPALAPASPPLARMGVAVLSLLGLLISAYLTLHRLGLVGLLLCGREGSCDRVQASPWSSFLGIPVPLIGLAGYLVLLALAVAGLQPGLAEDRRISWALLLLSGIAVAFTVYLTAIEALVLHDWCRWCVASAVVIVLIFACASADVLRRRRAQEAA